MYEKEELELAGAGVMAGLAGMQFLLLRLQVSMYSTFSNSLPFVAHAVENLI